MCRSGTSNIPLPPTHDLFLVAKDLYVSIRHGTNWVTFCDPATQWPVNPATPETQLTQWPCSIMKSKCWLMLQTNVCNGQEVCQFLSLFGVCTLLESKIFEDHLLNVNISNSKTVGGIFTKIYIFIFLSWAFFENRKNSGLTSGQNDEPVTQTWKMTVEK